MGLDINLLTYYKRKAHTKDGKEVQFDETVDLDPELNSKKDVNKFLEFVENEIFNYGDSVWKLSNILLDLSDLEKVLGYLVKNKHISPYTANSFKEIAEKGEGYFIIEVY